MLRRNANKKKPLMGLGVNRWRVLINLPAGTSTPDQRLPWFALTGARRDQAMQYLLAVVEETLRREAMDL